MTRVAIATCEGLPEGDVDLPALTSALAALDVAAEAVVWSDPAADWAAYDLVVVRSTWDYTTRLEEFLDWAGRVPRLANPAPVLRWNTDKRYLAELGDAGVPVVPTLWDPGDLPAGEGWEHFVIKPAVSAGAKDTARWGPGQEAAAAEHLRALAAQGRTVMVQPYLSAIDTAGETALIFIGGAFSHAARKAPILTVTGHQEVIGYSDSRERITPARPTTAELAVAELALGVAGRDLLYARVDVIPGPDGEPVLLELELTEPALFLRHSEGAADRLAAAIARQARQ
jgi:glutathione synthase/RimK-type ligase-like ATP-grasp enzyme